MPEAEIHPWELGHETRSILRLILGGMEGGVLSPGSAMVEVPEAGRRMRADRWAFEGHGIEVYVIPNKNGRNIPQGLPVPDPDHTDVYLKGTPEDAEFFKLKVMREVDRYYGAMERVRFKPTC